MLKCISTEQRCCLLTSHEHNLLPFSTPQSYALLSAESKETEAANNKERLGEYNDIVWCHTIFSALTSFFGLCCTLSRVESPGMMCAARANLIPRKQHTKLTAFLARVSIAQWCQPFLSVCVRSTAFKQSEAPLKKTERALCGDSFS